MSDKLTSISLPRVKNSGLSIWGEVSIGSAINQLREQARRDLVVAQAILDADDEDFRVSIVRGPVSQHEIERLQEGR